jgi:hypothetical protein
VDAGLTQALTSVSRQDSEVYIVEVYTVVASQPSKEPEALSRKVNQPIYDKYDLLLIDTFKGEGNTAPDLASEIQSAEDAPADES